MAHYCDNTGLNCLIQEFDEIDKNYEKRYEY